MELTARTDLYQGLTWTKDCRLQQFLDNKCLVYLDDIVVIGKICAKKCTMFQQQGNFLGDAMSSKVLVEIQKRSKQCESIHNLKINMKLEMFLRSLQLLRTICIYFGKIEKPLHSLAEKKTTFVWILAC